MVKMVGKLEYFLVCDRFYLDVKEVIWKVIVNFVYYEIGIWKGFGEKVAIVDFEIYYFVERRKNRLEKEEKYR